MRRVVVAFALFVAACGGGEPPSDGQASQGSGRIFIDWTVGGAAPSQASCAGIDHLVLTLDDGLEQFTIDPITCTLTRFRYDGLVEGRATLTLDALDAQGCRVASGQAEVDVTPNLPPAPTPTIAVVRHAPVCR